MTSHVATSAAVTPRRRQKTDNLEPLLLSDGILNIVTSEEAAKYSAKVQRVPLSRQSVKFETETKNKEAKFDSMNLTNHSKIKTKSKVMVIPTKHLKGLATQDPSPEESLDMRGEMSITQLQGSTTKYANNITVNGKKRPKSSVSRRKVYNTAGTSEMDKTIQNLAIHNQDFDSTTPTSQVSSAVPAKRHPKVHHSRAQTMNFHTLMAMNATLQAQNQTANKADREALILSPKTRRILSNSKKTPRSSRSAKRPPLAIK